MDQITVKQAFEIIKDTQSFCDECGKNVKIKTCNILINSRVFCDCIDIALIDFLKMLDENPYQTNKAIQL